MTKSRAQRFLRAAPILLLFARPRSAAVCPGRRLPQQQATNWADDVLKQESYAQPPKELADAVLAPRHLNVTLANLSPDKKWFVDEIGDGPVVMKTFSKPYHELGGVFVDYKANRARALTNRNDVGIQLSRPPTAPGADRDAARRARIERDLVARQRQRRLPRAYRRRDAHLDRGRRDRKVAAADQDPAARHAGHDVRVHRRRQADRGRARARQPGSDAPAFRRRPMVRR